MGHMHKGEALPADMKGGDASAAPRPFDVAKDPVCGMEVDKAKAAGSEYQGQTYYFCSDECKETFDANPARYMRKTGGGETPQAAAEALSQSQTGSTAERRFRAEG